MSKKFLFILLISLCSMQCFSQIYGVGNGDGNAVNCITWDVPVIVPVTLVKFDAVCSHGKTIIRWSVADASKGDYFAVERSADGIHFQLAGNIQVKENNYASQDYSLDDYSELKGKLYYRIKLTGSSGQFKYSNIIFVNCKAKDEVNVCVYPNPATSILNIITRQQKTSMVIKNISGQPVLYYKANTEKVTIDLGHLPEGLYLIEVQTKNNISYHKFVLSKN